MSDKINKMEEAAGLQYIKKFLVPMVAKEWSENWQSIAEQILKDIHRINDGGTVIFGEGITDMLFYKAMILGHSLAKKKTEIVFRTAKYHGFIIVSYYTIVSNGQWYRIDTTPDKAILRRFSEAHNPQPGYNINKEEEIDAERTIIQHLLHDAISWFNERSSWTGIKRKEVTEDEVRRGMRKVLREPDFILYKFGATSDPLWFGISKKVYDNEIISIGYHVGPIRKDLKRYHNKAWEIEDDYKIGWIWRQYSPDKGKWDVFIENKDDNQFFITKREEHECLQFLRDNVLPQYAKSLEIPVERLKNTLKKIQHDTYNAETDSPVNEIRYMCETGKPKRPKLFIIFYKNDKQQLVVGMDDNVSIHSSHAIFNHSPGKQIDLPKPIDENDPPKPGESKEAYINRVVKISSREEAEGLHFIKKFLLNRTAHAWNNSTYAIGHQELQVIADELLKNLKKVHRRFIPADKCMERHAHEKVVYTSHISDKKSHVYERGLIFTFYITKNDAGKLIVCFITPGRTDAGSCYSLHKLMLLPQQLKENVGKIRRINKKEESEALQYIRSVLGPAAVNTWNQKTMQHQFESGTIIKQLKKTVDTRPPNDIKKATINTDYIQYSITIPVRDVTLNHKVFFTFSIYKNKYDKLVVSFETPLIDGGPYVVGTNPMTGKRNTVRERTIREAKDLRLVITKMDEYRAVDFIKKLILPLAVRKWNRDYFKPTTEEFTRKTMKKILHHEWLHKQVSSDYVNYTSDTPIENIKFIWEIWKDNSGLVMVGYSFTNNENLISTYYIDDPSPIDEAAEPFWRDPSRKEYIVTKMEEAKAIQYIKTKIIPDFVEFVNQTNDEYGGQSPITIQDMIKTLKKIHQDNDRYGIIYQALFRGEPTFYDIFKNTSGYLFVRRSSDDTNYRIR